MGEQEKSYEDFRKAAVEARKAGDRKAEEQALHALGNLYSDEGDFRQALACYERAFEIESEDDGEVPKADQYWSMSLAVDLLGGRERAIELAEAALRIYELENHPNMDQVRIQLGKWTGVNQGILDRLEEEVRKAEEAGDLEGLQTALAELGNAYAELGEIRTAVEYYEQALAADIELEDAQGGAERFWSMALAVDRSGGTGRALELAEGALEMFDSVRDSRAEDVRKFIETRKTETDAS